MQKKIPLPPPELLYQISRDSNQQNFLQSSMGMVHILKQNLAGYADVLLKKLIRGTSAADTMFMRCENQFRGFQNCLSLFFIPKQFLVVMARRGK